MREPEPRIVAAAAAGDIEAFTLLMVEYQDPVWRFLTRLIGDRSLAEDLTQETFLRVHRGLSGFDGRSRLSTWIFGIARHVGIDAIRRQRRRPQVVSSLSESTVGDSQRWSAHASDVDKDAILDVHEAIDSLSVAHRETLLLVEVLGLSYREVGEVTGVAEGTVKSRMFHARRSLHAQLSHADDARRARIESCEEGP